MSKPFTRFWPLLAVALLALAALLWWMPAPAPTAKPTAATPAPKSTPATTPTPAPVPVAPATPPAPPPTATEVALNTALATPDPRTRAQAFGQLFFELVQSDPEAALAYLRKMQRGQEFSQALFTLLDAISRRDLDRSLELAAELAVAREDRAFYSALFDRLGREAIQDGLSRLDRVPRGEARDYALRALADAWARSAPAAALAWAQALPDPADRTPALETVLRNVSERDPLEAIALAQKSLTGLALERTLSIAIQRLTNTDPTAAAERVGMMPPGDTQTMTAVNVARALADQKGIDVALTWIAGLPVELLRWIVLNNVLTTWSQKDPLAAARYVAEMPPGGGLDFAAQHMGLLLGNKPHDAIMWAEALPTTTARDGAFVSIASAWAQREPTEAVKWAVTLQGEPLRTNALAGAFTYWQMMDQNAARAWLEQADLPPATKAKVRYRER